MIQLTLQVYEQAIILELKAHLGISSLLDLGGHGSNLFIYNGAKSCSVDNVKNGGLQGVELSLPEVPDGPKVSLGAGILGIVVKPQDGWNNLLFQDF